MPREPDDDELDTYPATREARMTLFASLPPTPPRPELRLRAHTDHAATSTTTGRTTPIVAPLSAPAGPPQMLAGDAAHAEHEHRVTQPSHVLPTTPGAPLARPARPARRAPIASASAPTSAGAAASTDPVVVPASPPARPAVRRDAEHAPDALHLSPRFSLLHTPRSGPATPLREVMDYFGPALAAVPGATAAAPAAGTDVSPANVPEEVARAGLLVQDLQGRPAGLFFSPGHVAVETGPSAYPSPGLAGSLHAPTSPGAPLADAGEAEPPHDPTDPEVTPARSEREETVVLPRPGAPESAAANFAHLAQKGRLPGLTSDVRDLPSLKAAAHALSVLPSTGSGAPRGPGPSSGPMVPRTDGSTVAAPPMVPEGSSTPQPAPKGKMRPKVRPKKARVKEARAEDKKAKIVLPPIKVLLVEDNKINVQILTRLLTRNQIQFDVAKNGMEAIAKWRDGSFHIIFMDIQLPVLDGIVATKVIRRQEAISGIGKYPPPGTHTARDLPPLDGSWEGCDPALLAKALATAAGTDDGGAAKAGARGGEYRPAVIIVALTASSFDSDRVAALAAGCNDFLNKPVDHKWLERKISEWGSMQYLLLAGLSWHAAPPAPLGPSSAQGGRKVPRPALSAQRDRAARVRDFERAQARQAKLLAERMHMPANPLHRTGSPSLAPSSVVEETSPTDPPPPASASTTAGTATPVTLEAPPGNVPRTSAAPELEEVNKDVRRMA